MMIRTIGFVFLVVFLLGCVASSPAPVIEETALDSVDASNAPIVNGPGKVIEFCNFGTVEENEECFEDAFVTCEKALGMFWTTLDDAVLHFETLGIEDNGNCGVRVTVTIEESAFFGQTANCSVPKSPASGEHAEPFFDSYEIGMDTCTGTFVDAIVKSAQSLVVEENEPSPVPAPVKEFSFTVNESGVVGTKEFTVNEGDVVRFTITVDTQDVSFNGEQVYGPPKTSANPKSIFDAGHLKPGQTKTVEFVATGTFEFAVYWPGSSVLKGKGKVSVIEN